MAFSRRLTAALAGLALAALVAFACSPQGSSLARRDDDGANGGSPSGGSAGSGGKAGAPGGAGGKAGGGAGGQAGSAGQGGAGAGGKAGAGGDPPVIDEPDGPPEFRFLNGVTDAAAIELCLVPWGADGPGAIDTEPQPAGSGGLPYGGLLVPSLPPGVEAASTSLRPYVLAGDLSATGGKGCLGLVASPPEGLRVSALPVLPAGALTAPRSRLAVVAGCAGGGSVPDVNSACGVGVDPQKGNLSLLLVELSRRPVPADRVALQVVHASTAMPELQVLTVPFGGTLSVTVVSSIELGQIAPRPPLTSTVGQLFGSSTVAGSQIKVADAKGGPELALFPVATTLAESGLSEADVAAGKNLVMVVLGPRPGSPVDAAPVTPTRLLWLRVPAL